MGQFLVYINGLAILIGGEEVSSSSTVTKTALPQKHRLPQKETVCPKKSKFYAPDSSRAFCVTDLPVSVGLGHSEFFTLLETK